MTEAITQMSGRFLSWMFGQPSLILSSGLLQHTNDFPLYTEAIKFFKHSESMVRIAVRTLTLNVYRVQDASMLKFIEDKTAAPYFSNLVWFIGNHVLELDACVRNDAEWVTKLYVR